MDMREYQNELNQLSAAYDEEKAKNQELQQHVASTMFNAEDDSNLVKWQLDIKDELERIEHLLKKHVPKTDKDGNEYFEESSEENKLFNNWGVSEILNILAWYLCKNIILSNFSEEDIILRCKQFSEELSHFIFNNYEQMGLDNKDKIKHYPMVVLNIVNTVEAAYYRALNGGERESLTKRTNIIQSLGPTPQPSAQPMPQQKHRSWLNPVRWVSGK